MTIRRLLRWPFYQLARFCFRASGRLNRVAQRLHYVPLAATAPAAPAPAPAPETKPAEPDVDVDALIAEMRRLRAIADGAGSWSLPRGLHGDPRPAPPEGASN